MIEKYTKIFINALIRWLLLTMVFCLIWWLIATTLYIINELTGLKVDNFVCWLCGMFTLSFLDSLKGKEND